MGFGNHRSIKTKILLLACISVGVALTLCYVGFTAYEAYSMRKAKTAELQTQAQMLAFTSTGVLSFQDAPAARKLLLALQSQPAVEYACLYDAGGRVLAFYPEAARGETAPPAPPSGELCRSSERAHRGIPADRRPGRTRGHALSAGPT